ncbi:iron complex transport system substrate-binding protein [Loktanella fryxellensis]|uniref:Iron complex transport system substrate-binding protein n=1 Tax=Loktanella fryxellensis TaxID=245187 RepID=A0A1H8HCN6_9RHOB|nr:iron-siderophore ABC transporter substrate-binding protein [Loktanella fryxellensis]SEN54002.1 iron complex transport system substrate-binding protein [Loktanella fryxellensis]
MTHPTLIAAVCLTLLGQGVLAQDYPQTIVHAFGTTVLTAKPERIATVAWANHEVPLALGVVPVGMAAAKFGDDDGDGLLPWVVTALDDLGADVPVLFDEGDGIDFEGVAATDPDVILAAYSGLSQSDYDTLSQIAPVVAYPDQPWAADWREMIRLNAAGMGMVAEGDALIAELEGQIAAEVAAYPVLQGKTAMFVTHVDGRDLSTLSFYTAADTRVRFFADLGLGLPQAVRDASADGTFSAQVSAERIDDFADADIVVNYGGVDLVDAMTANPLTARMAAVQTGSVVLLGNDPMGTAANPTPLSIPFVLDDYVALLADAASRTE